MKGVIFISHYVLINCNKQILQSICAYFLYEATNVKPIFIEYPL